MNITYTQNDINTISQIYDAAINPEVIDSSIYFWPVGDSTNTRRHFYADLEMFAFSNKNPDPDDYLRAWICTEAAQRENNWSRPNWARYCNREFDTLYEQSRTAPDPDKWRALIIAMNDLLIADAAVIPLVEKPTTFGMCDDIAGYAPTAWDVHPRDIKDWWRK